MSRMTVARELWSSPCPQEMVVAANPGGAAPGGTLLIFAQGSALAPSSTRSSSQSGGTAALSDMA